MPQHSSHKPSPKSRRPRGRDRHISIRSVRRDPPDLEKIAKAIADQILLEVQREQQERETSK